METVKVANCTYVTLHYVHYFTLRYVTHMTKLVILFEITVTSVNSIIKGYVKLHYIKLRCVHDKSSGFG